jgi:putative flippase GtrA
LPNLIESAYTNPRLAKIRNLANRNPSLAKLLDFVYNNSKELERFIKFAIVGTIGTVVDFSVLNALILRVGFTKFWANNCSFSTAVISNFLWNRLWTFPESLQRPIAPQLGQFALVNVIGLAINQAIFLSLDRFLLGPMLGGPWGYNLSKAVAIIVVLFWNFGINRIWTYRGI